MGIKFYPDENAIYVQLRDTKIAYGKDLGDKRAPWILMQLTL